MNKILVFALLVLVSCKSENTFVISGKVTDFCGQPIDSVSIQLKNRAFENICTTLSDKEGNYSMQVREGDYYCLYAIKQSEYRVNRLEYWTWNVPVHKDMTINPQYDRMEIYGINVFEPQVSPHDTYMIYFRPMSLSKGLELASLQEVDKSEFETARRTEALLDSSIKLINISPDSISTEELTIEINGEKSDIVGINKITEYGRGFYIFGYVVQVLKPDSKPEDAELEYDLISITLNSKQTGEIGKGEAFIKR